MAVTCLAVSPEKAPGPRSGLGLALGDSRAFARRIGAEDPATAAGAELREEPPGLAASENDLVALGELRPKPVRRRSARAACPQLLHHGVRVALRKPDLVTSGKQRLEPVGLVHSCGFSGVPDNPSWNLSLNRRATASGTSVHLSAEASDLLHDGSRSRTELRPGRFSPLRRVAILGLCRWIVWPRCGPSGCGDRQPC
jgi:hypothetical protein